MGKGGRGTKILSMLGVDGDRWVQRWRWPATSSQAGGYFKKVSRKFHCLRGCMCRCLPVPYKLVTKGCPPAWTSPGFRLPPAVGIYCCLFDVLQSLHAQPPSIMLPHHCRLYDWVLRKADLGLSAKEEEEIYEELVRGSAAPALGPVAGMTEGAAG